MKPSCEHCGHKDAELRNSDMNLCEKQEEQESTCHHNTEESLSAIVKHKHDSDGSCTKCKKTLKNDVRCLTCTKEFHWRCAGVSLESVKESVKQENKWSVYFVDALTRTASYAKTD